MHKKRLIFAILLVLLLKVILLLFFSSGYQNQLFIPFVKHFITHGGNPWEQFFLEQKVDSFPYHPLMLYIISLFYLPFHLLSSASILLQNLFFKLPALLSDILITYLLYRLFPDKLKEIIIFYFASPVILYASYMHSQLDLIPTAILFLSIYLLVTRRILFSAFVFACALLTKFHVIAAYPLMLAYLIKNRKKREIFYFLAIPAGLYLIFSYPYIISEAYYHMVLYNPKQQLLFATFFTVGSLKVYIPIFIGFIIVFRFMVYRKINNDLFYAFLAILFSSLMLTITPAPGWYIWMLPFFCVFFIKFYKGEKRLLYLYLAFAIAYMLYVILFFIPDYPDLIFVDTPLNFKIHNEKIREVFFTVFEAILLVTIYYLYKLGVRSSLIYKRDSLTVIAICGDSAAGKSVLSSDIKLVLGDRLLDLEGDADHKWERDDTHWRTLNHLNPKANYIYRQAENILKLKTGKSVYMVDYDHNSGKFTRQKEIRAESFIAINGLHTLYLPIMREIADLKIYLDTDEKLRRRWKIARDVQERHYSGEEAIAQIEKRAEDSGKYIYPQKEYADMIINYFSDEHADASGGSSALPMKLKIIFDSGIDIEFLVHQFDAAGIKISWDYADDLRKQYIIFSEPVKRDVIKSMGRQAIRNTEELLAERPVWLDGYRGIVQLFVLLVLSEKIKKEEN